MTKERIGVFGEVSLFRLMRSFCLELLLSRVNVRLKFLLLLSCLLVPCVSMSAPLKVVATTGMIGDLAMHIGGEHVVVESLMGPGVDPHLYRATQGDIKRLTQADVILYNGLHLEGKMVAIFAKLARRKVCVAVAESIPTEKLRQPPEFEGQYDPHVWFDLSLWKIAGERVLEVLSELRPDDASELSANATKYFQELDALEQWAREKVTTVPVSQRVLVTAHDAFGYFGDAYGFEVMALQGMSTATEYGLHDLKRLTDLILARGIKSIFVESSVPKRFIESLLAGVNARGGKVTLGGELFSDAMGESGTTEGTYLGMFRHNVETIATALR